MRKNFSPVIVISRILKLVVVDYGSVQNLHDFFLFLNQKKTRGMITAFELLIKLHGVPL